VQKRIELISGDKIPNSAFETVRQRKNYDINKIYLSTIED